MIKRIIAARCEPAREGQTYRQGSSSRGFRLCALAWALQITNTRRVWAIGLLAGMLAAPPLLAQGAGFAEQARRGKAALAAGRYDEAISIYAGLVEALPQNAGLRMNLGFAHHLAGNDSQAVEHFRSALHLDSNLAPAKLFLGAGEMRLGRPEKAVEPLSDFLKLQPDHQQARGMLADALLTLDRYAEAAAHFRRLADRTPRDPKVLYALGQSYQGLAQQEFANLESRDPESPYFLALVAETRASQQEYSSAFFLYRQALQRKRDMRGIHSAVAEIYHRTGHADWAAKEEKEEAELAPLRCSPPTLECLFEQERFVEVLEETSSRSSPEALYWKIRAANELARTSFARLEELPDSVEWRRVQAQTLANQGRHLEAAEQLQRALELEPGNPAVQIELARAYRQSRQCEKAQPLLEKLVRNLPGDPQVQYLQGACLLSQQQPDEAIPWLEGTIETAPEIVGAHLSLGRAYLQAGRAADAIPYLEAALELDTDGSVHFQLARAYQRSGNRNKAMEMMDQYRQIQQQVQQAQQEIEDEVKITPPE